MNPFQSDSRKLKTRRRLLPALLAAVVVNLAIQPCAMALGLNDGCAHCPPAEESAMPMHRGHELAPDEAPCASSPGACDLTGASIDGRTVQLKVKDTGELPVALLADVAALVVPSPHDSPHSLVPPDIPGSAPPVRVLYCVYLK